jgi:hypothetical protein
MGTKSTPVSYPKDGAESKQKCSAGSKCIKEQMLDIQATSDIGTAPTSRVYTRDYLKVGREEGDTDLVTAALGNPFRL